MKDMILSTKQNCYVLEKYKYPELGRKPQYIKTLYFDLQTIT